ncbi:mannitol dehydrogenase family protein [Spirosoma pulveris]
MFTTTQEVSTESFSFFNLKAAHSVLAYPAFLAGYRTVHEAMEDNFVSAYVRAFLTTTAKSNVSSDVNSEEDINRSIEQLTNSGEELALDQLCQDGASKLSSFVIPILLDRLEQGKDVTSLTFLLAAYGHYLQAGIDDKGQEYTVVEPQLSQRDWSILTQGDTLSLLDISALASARLRTFPQVVAQYKSYRHQLACYGLLFSLKQALCAFWEEEPEGINSHRR